MATTTRRQSQATTLTRLDTTWRSVLELQLFCSWFLLITRWSNFAAETIMMGQSNMLGEGKIAVRFSMLEKLGWRTATHMKGLDPYLQAFRRHHPRSIAKVVCECVLLTWSRWTLVDSDRAYFTSGKSSRCAMIVTSEKQHAFKDEPRALTGPEFFKKTCKPCNVS